MMKKMQSFFGGRVMYSVMILSFYLVVLLSITLSGTYSGYISSAEGSDTCVVAKFQVSSAHTMNGSETINIENLKPGSEPQIIRLEITNESEVNVDYQFSAAMTYGNLPLQFEISEDGAGTLTWDGPQTVTHTLTVIWPATAISAEYANMVDTLTITLKCEQKN